MYFDQIECIASLYGAVAVLYFLVHLICGIVYIYIITCAVSYSFLVTYLRLCISDKSSGWPHSMALRRYYICFWITHAVLYFSFELHTRYYILFVITFFYYIPTSVYFDQVERIAYSMGLWRYCICFFDFICSILYIYIYILLHMRFINQLFL